MSAQMPPEQPELTPEQAAQLQAMVTQLREGPVDVIVAQVANSLLEAIQIKLGRADARVLIDALAAVVERVSGSVDEALAQQLGDAVSQVRLAQVESEKDPDAAGEAPEASNSVAEAPAAAAAPSAPSEAPTTGSDPSSRLWVPGR